MHAQALKFSQNSFDMGLITTKDTLNVVFKFTNQSPDVCSILAVLSCSSCGAVYYPRTPIQPNQTDSISIRFIAAGQLGPQNRVITVLTTDNNAQPYRLTLTGRVQGTVQRTPRRRF